MKNAISLTMLIDVVSLYLHPARPPPPLLRIELRLKSPRRFCRKQSDKSELFATAISAYSRKVLLVHRAFSKTEEAMSPVLSTLKRLEIRFNFRSVHGTVYENNRNMVLTECDPLQMVVQEQSRGPRI